MNEKLKPALIGGLVAGVLSFIPLLGCFCGIGGGLIAGYLYIKKAPVPVQVGESATLGAMAGIVAGLIRIMGGFLLTFMLEQGAGLEAQLHEYGFKLPFSATIILVVATVLAGIVILGLSTVGGMIAVPLFEKRKGGPTAPPPPPENFDAGQPGSFGAGL